LNVHSNLNAQDGIGNSFLIYAAMNGNNQLVEYLIQEGI